jgi:hypothetical protein
MLHLAKMKVQDEASSYEVDVKIQPSSLGWLITFWHKKELVQSQYLEDMRPTNFKPLLSASGRCFNHRSVWVDSSVWNKMVECAEAYAKKHEGDLE